VSTSWPMFLSQCKSRLSALARECFLSREHWKAKCAQQSDESKSQIKELESRCERAEAASERFEKLWQLQIQKTEALEHRLDQTQRLIQLPDDPPAPGQHYGPALMALSVNLARTVGLRKSVAAMQVFFRWLNVDKELPTYQTIRGWMFRLGLNRLQHAGWHDDWLWIVDHSNQIGKQKCLLVLGVQQSKLPPEGTPLQLKDMKVLGLFPSEKCNRESVGEVYRQIADKYGIPRAVISDGAVELREPVNRLRAKGKAAISIRDLKHFLANRLEHLLSKDRSYQEFLQELGKARSSIQQTELSHLTPPVMRQKARFMNLAPLLEWANMALWHLKHPASESRGGITDQRMQEKLAWLERYEADLEKWTIYQTIISTALTFINKQGLKQNTSRELRNLLKPFATQATKPLIRKIIKFIQIYEKKLYLNERLPMSSEIIESSFAKFKALEQSHARSGLTHLVLAIPCLLKAATAKEIVSAFAKTKVRHTQEWLKEHLPKTHDARRQTAYREFRQERASRYTKKCATPLTTAV
jgi:hypothetical protein